MQIPVNPYFCVLVQNGPSSWVSTPVTSSTSTEELQAFRDTLLAGFVLTSNDARVIAQRVAGESVLFTVTSDKYWFTTLDNCRKFLTIWIEETRPAARARELEKVFSQVLDPFTPFLDKTVDIEATTPADPPTAQPLPLPYDIQLYWQPADDAAWEASVKLRVGDAMPNFSEGGGLMAVGGKFTRVDVFTDAGFAKVKHLLSGTVKGSLPYTYVPLVIPKVVADWNKPAKIFLDWETGGEVLRNLIVGSYFVHSADVLARVQGLAKEFGHFCDLKTSGDYPFLPWIMALTAMQTKLDKILEQ